MTDAQREAATEAMAQGIHLSIWPGGPPYNDGRCADYKRSNSRFVAAKALTALTDAGFLILHRDDVTEEYGTVLDSGTVMYALPDRAANSRLVTRWESITTPPDVSQTNGPEA